MESAGQLLGIRVVRRVHAMTGCAFFTTMIVALPLAVAAGAIAAIAAVAS